MHARVSSYEFPPERADEVIAAFDADDRLPALAGVVEAYLLVDREAGTALTLTVWEDEAALRATERAADEIRAGATGPAGGAVRRVDRYEVALHERFAPSGGRAGAPA